MSPVAGSTWAAPIPFRCLLDGHFDQRLAARFRRVGRRGNFSDHPLDQPPAIAANDHNGDFSSFKVLLIGEIFVGGQ